MRISWTKAVTAALVGASLLAVAARAEQTRRWHQSTYEEFLKGTPKGIALRSDGGLELAPRFATFADADASYLWALRFDSQGHLYAAGGSPARVFRFDASGKPTTVFEAGELSAQALAIDAKDNLYVGTNPDGKIYRVTPEGEKSVFFEPKTKYIWDLALAPDGTLYVATGDKGQVFAVSLDGKGEVFYSTDETHVRTLAFDGKGHLLAGTEPNGRILRLTLRMAAKPGAKPNAVREAFVLYETPKREVTSIAVDAKGNIYAAAIGDKQRAPAPITIPGAAPQPAIPPAPAQIGLAGMAGLQTGFVPFPPFISSAVYRIAPDGAPEELWGSREDLVYALGFARDGNLLLGTGNNGSILEVESRGVFSNLVKSGASQVTGIVRGLPAQASQGGKTFFATANPGRIVTLASEHEAEGTYESQSFDAQLFSEWGRLEWWGDAASASSMQAGAKPRVEFYVRSGNTSDPGKEWSPWSGPYASPAGDKAQCPPARFVQWKVVLRDGRPGDRIDWVSLAYLPRNVAPGIDAIVLQDPGIRVQGPVMGGGPNVSQPVTLKLPPPPAGTPVGLAVAPQSAERKPARPDAPPQGFAQKGYRSVLWSAHDDNDDDLIFSIYYRGEAEHEWKLLKDKLDQKFYSWDTTAMPDGAYYLKIVASDAPSNPPALALTAERTGDRFEVDNTPPLVEGLAAEPGSPAIRVRWNAVDATSAIERAEYSLDAGDWTLVNPAGGLSDARRESYELTLPALAPGEHTLAVRVADSYENLASAKVTFIVPGAKR
jgi:sugar lactone lactonase YvrE